MRTMTRLSANTALHRSAPIVAPGELITWTPLLNSRMSMIDWKSEKFWLGKLLGHPEIMTQGESLEKQEENTKDACLLTAMEDVPEKHKI